MRKVSLIPVLIAFSVLPHAASAGDAVVRGATVVEEWCRYCHLHASDQPDPVMAPSFEELVLREGRDRAYLWKFLHDDHFPMPTYRLHEDEKADVVEYLLSLQQPQE